MALSDLLNVNQPLLKKSNPNDKKIAQLYPKFMSASNLFLRTLNDLNDSISHDPAITIDKAKAQIQRLESAVFLSTQFLLANDFRLDLSLFEPNGCTDYTTVIFFLNQVITFKMTSFARLSQVPAYLKPILNADAAFILATH